MNRFARFGLSAALLLSLGKTPALVAQGTAQPSPEALDQKIRALESQQAELQKSMEGLRKALAESPAPGTSRDIQDRMAQLEKQLAELKKDIDAIGIKNAAKQPAPIENPGLKPLSFDMGSTGQVSSGTSFNPSISVIPNFAYYHDNKDGEAPEIFENADGFHGAHAEDEHDHGGLTQGFNLLETEIAFKASVDPYFDVAALFAVSEEGIEAEEVYFQTRRLPLGLTLKGGKFLSGIGYTNSQHPHQWDFVDQNLAYELLLGSHGLNEKGIQLAWVPKLPFYLQLGGEVLQGENEKIANYIGPEEFPAESEEDAPVVLSEKAGPRLFTGFLKVGPNIGYSNALQFGVSYASSQSHQEVHVEEGETALEVLDGKAELWGLDLVFKYDSPREYGAGDFVFQTEYLFRKKDLDILGTSEKAVIKQDGSYFQAIYGIAPRFQLAARCDVAGMTNEKVEAGIKTSYGSSKRYTAALTFNPTEFSRVRAQYNRGESWIGGEKQKYDQFFLQVQFSIGAHGAHKF